MLEDSSTRAVRGTKLNMPFAKDLVFPFPKQSLGRADG